MRPAFGRPLIAMDGSLARMRDSGAAKGRGRGRVNSAPAAWALGAPAKCYCLCKLERRPRQIGRRNSGRQPHKCQRAITLFGAHWAHLSKASFGGRASRQVGRSVGRSADRQADAQTDGQTDRSTAELATRRHRTRAACVRVVVVVVVVVVVFVFVCVCVCVSRLRRLSCGAEVEQRGGPRGRQSTRRKVERRKGGRVAPELR